METNKIANNEIIPEQQEEETEIDLLELWYVIRARIWSILLAGLILATAVGAYTRFLVTPMYTSEATMLVLTKETTLSSLADLQIGSQLTGDYSILIQSRRVLQTVIKNLNLDMTYQDLRELVSVTNEQDTRILSIDVQMDDPEMAKTVVDELASVSSAFIADQMEVTAPKIIEKGEIPTRQTSPSLLKNDLIGFLVGILIATAYVVIEALMNDSIVVEDDVTKYLGIPTLASVPYKADGTEDDQKSRKKKKKHRKEEH